MNQYVSLLVIAAFMMIRMSESVTMGSDAEAEFAEWLLSYPSAFVGSVALGQGAFGRGVIAQAPIRAGDVVLHVPRSLIQTAASARKALPALLARLPADHDDHILALQILRLHALPALAKTFRPYLQLLPAPGSIPNLRQLDDATLSSLTRHPRLVDAVTNSRTQWESQFKLFSKDARAILHGASKSDLKNFSQESMYYWARQLVESRALTISGVKYLVPFADMFNYQWDGKRREHQNGLSFHHTHRFEDDVFAIYADRDCEAGHELFEDYGDNDNRIYAVHHGFVYENNSFDCIDLNLRELNPSATIQEILIKAGIQPSYCLRADHDLPLQLSIFFTLIGDEWTATQVKECTALLASQPTVNKDQALLRTLFAQCAHAINPAKIRKRLVALLSTYKAELKTTPSMPTSTLNSNDFGKAWQLALEYRHQRLNLLNRLLKTFQLKSNKSTPAHSEPHVVVVEPSSNFATVGVQTSTSDLQVNGASPDVVSEEQTHSAASPKVHARMLQWMAKSGTTTNLITVAPEPLMRFGTVTTKDIAAEDIYLSVPRSIIMSSSTAMLTPSIDKHLVKLDELHGKGGDQEKLLLFLVHQRYVAKKNSPFWPYLATLPTLLDMQEVTPHLYGPDNFALLVNTSVIDLLNSHIRERDNRIRILQQIAIDPFPDVFPPKSVSRNELLWAHSILDSRSIWFGGVRNLVPLLDMINCGAASGPTRQRPHKTVLDSTNQFAITRAPRAYKAGEFLHENYGQPNHVYYAYHGFVLDENDSNCYLLTLELDTQGARFASQQSALRNAGFEKNKLTSCVTSIRSLPKDLIKFARIYFGSQTDAAAILKLKKYLETKLRNLQYLLDQPAMHNPQTSQQSAIQRYASQERVYLQQLLKS